MMSETDFGSYVSFQVVTPTTIGRTALDSFPRVCDDLMIGNPYWLLPDEIVQQRSVKKIISRVYGKNHMDWDKVSTIIHPTMDEKVLQELGEEIRGQGYDGLVVVGDSDTLNTGKRIGSIAEAETDPLQMKTIMIPCGESDCSEFLDSSPSLSIGDGRLTRATTPKNVARTVCSALMHLSTSLLDHDNPMLMGFAESGLQYAHQTMELLLEPGLTGQRWIDCTLFAIATSHNAGVCAQNSGESTIVDFCKHLAIAGLADQYQTTAAMLPYVFSLIEKENRPLYTHMKRLLQGMDPIEFTKAWLTLTEPKGTDRILQQLCGELNGLFFGKEHVEELVPFLSQFPVGRRS